MHVYIKVFSQDAPYTRISPVVLQLYLFILDIVEANDIFFYRLYRRERFFLFRLIESAQNGAKTLRGCQIEIIQLTV